MYYYILFGWNICLSITEKPQFHKFKIYTWHTIPSWYRDITLLKVRFRRNVKINCFSSIINTFPSEFRKPTYTYIAFCRNRTFYSARAGSYVWQCNIGFTVKPYRDTLYTYTVFSSYSYRTKGERIHVYIYIYIVLREQSD